MVHLLSQCPMINPFCNEWKQGSNYIDVIFYNDDDQGTVSGIWTVSR